MSFFSLMNSSGLTVYMSLSALTTRLELACKDRYDSSALSVGDIACNIDGTVMITVGKLTAIHLTVHVQFRQENVIVAGVKATLIR